MHVRRHLSLLPAALLFLAALAAAGAALATPAFAGVVTGRVTDQFANPIDGLLVETLDSVTGAPFATGTTGEGGDFAIEIVSPASGQYKLRVSDPTGTFTTSYYLDQPTFETGELIGYS